MELLSKVKCRIRIVRFLTFLTLVNAFHLQCVVSDCADFANASRTFLDENLTAPECLKRETIIGTVRNGDPTEAVFRHDNQFDHSTRSIYSFAFDVTLLNSSVAGNDYSSTSYEYVTQDALPVFQVANATSALFSLSVYILPLGAVEWITILNRTQYENSIIYENTFFFDIDPPLLAGPGVLLFYLWLSDYQWPANIASADGNGYLNFLSCLDGSNCDVFRDSWRDLKVDYEQFVCPKPYSDELRAYLHICHNTTLPASPESTTGEECSVPGPLGMENRFIIQDEQITASDYDSGPGNAPEEGRLNNRDLFWATSVGNPTDPWIQVDFQENVIITGIQTQGSSSSSWNDWVKRLQVQSGDSEESLTYIADVNGPETFEANTDRNSIKDIPFRESIKARFLRIIPTDWENWISLRFEVIGCRTAIASTRSVVSTLEATTTATTTPTLPTTTAKAATTLITTDVQTSDSEAACQEPLGLEDGRILDSQLNASTVWNDNHGPSNARLNRPAQFIRNTATMTTGAWSVGEKYNDTNQWIQVDLGVSTMVTGVLTQGRASNVNDDCCPQWVTKFKVQYSNDGSYWEFVQSANNQSAMIFDGNTDQDTVITNPFPTPVSASYIRILPTEWNQWISLRFEVVGCQLQVSTVSDEPTDEATTIGPMTTESKTQTNVTASSASTETAEITYRPTISTTHSPSATTESMDQLDQDLQNYL
ncbi:EGF-like repeat and discoidin I-like domain-containing protein 3 [Amphiura filiformis]|uniref:EGF-like repeat and discoidin I-like domain-containing protein 3 n=1 Tax=Amphiura filiformis TaxID=82378 RepID=UPI003B210D5E